MFHYFHYCLLMLVGLSLAICSGCSEKMPYKVVPLEGTITYKGKPLEKVNLEFAVKDYRASGAILQGGGRFKTVHMPGVDGVPVGKCTLKIGWAGADAPPPEYIELFAKYGLDSEGYVFEITKADKEFKIDLE